MRHLWLIVLVCCFSQTSMAQQYEKIWMFGESNTLDFSGASPVPGGIPNMGGSPPQWYFHRSGAVCDAKGKLQFWVKLQSQTGPNAALTPNAFDRFGDPMPNGNLLSNYSSAGVPVFVPYPDDTNRYYVFYIKNGGLLYSVIDMRLNGGKGDVIQSVKNVLLGSWNTVVDYKMTAVQGCRNVWIVCRSRATNEFFSYEITKAGVSSMPVVSVCGLLPVAWYVNGNNVGDGYYSRGGVMKASPDGRKLAVASNASIYPEIPGKGGIELFDFETCSGKVSNPVLLASGSYYGACFSPDNSKLYTSAIYQRSLYQFDLSLSSTAAVIASKTLILTNPTYNNYPESWLLGDAKRGLDGKVYIGNYNCDNVNTNAMHVINQPNLVGLACLPVINGLSLGANAGCTGFNLPADIVVFPHYDTIIGQASYVTACFTDSVQLSANNGGKCYHWLDGPDGDQRYVHAKGTYVCTYSGGDCNFHIDTFKVWFPKKPIGKSHPFSCPTLSGGTMIYVNADTTTYTYSWSNLSGHVTRRKQTQEGDTLTGLDTGYHVITFITSDGCTSQDTFNVQVLPTPVADFSMPQTSCVGQAVHVENRSTAPIINWQVGLDTAKKKQISPTFWETGNQNIRQIVTNIEGCSDTLDETIFIRSFKLLLEATEEEVFKNQQIQLTTSSSESYTVQYWKPGRYFSDSIAYRQVFIVDTTTRILVKGVSDYGCEDTVSIQINVKPYLFIPNAFTPNGDGKNDRFKPINSGAPILIVYFYIYNRWGQLVYNGQGPSAQEGWDGTYRGKPCDIGSYYYTIQIETPQGVEIKQNGDLTLIR